MPIRNPFRRAPEATDEAQRNASDNEFKNTAVTGAQPLQIKDSAEYKLSGALVRVLPRMWSQEAWKPCVRTYGG